MKKLEDKKFGLDRAETLQHQFSTSRDLYNKAVGMASSSKSTISDYLTTFLVGSYGRFEASDRSSDLEWLVVFDDSRVSAQEAAIYQANLTERFANAVGRERLSIGKTFGDVIPRSNLNSNIGGIADTTRMLTYRMLCLAEGTPLQHNVNYENIIGDLAYAYGSTHTAGHRLLSFATEIARYWRTLRIDYKQKVDEQRKPWAVRGMKLRGGRRYWYFSMILFFVAFGPRLPKDGRDRENDSFEIKGIIEFMLSLNLNPTQRIVEAALEIGVEDALIEELFQIYDCYLSVLSDPNNRTELDRLLFENRYSSATYKNLKSSCVDLHETMAKIVISLPEFHRNQLIEMFLL